MCARRLRGYAPRVDEISVQEGPQNDTFDIAFVRHEACRVKAGADVWGLISDVHGNYVALEEALRVLSLVGAKRLAFLGDYLGKGDPDRCAQLIREVADVAIVGNRDLDWQDRVSAASKAWVLRLPRTAQIGPLLLAHGDVRLTPALSTNQIGKDFARAWQEMDDIGVNPPGTNDATGKIEPQARLRVQPQK